MFLYTNTLPINKLFVLSTQTHKIYRPRDEDDDVDFDTDGEDDPLHLMLVPDCEINSISHFVNHEGQI